MEKKHKDLKSISSDDSETLDRRSAMRKIVKKAAYAVPIAAVMLSAAKDAKAGVIITGLV